MSSRAQLCYMVIAFWGIQMLFCSQSHLMHANIIIIIHEKLLQFYWLIVVVFQLNLKYLYVKIANLLWVVV